MLTAYASPTSTDDDFREVVDVATVQQSTSKPTGVGASADTTNTFTRRPEAELSRSIKTSHRKAPSTKVLLTLNQIAVMTQNGVEVADALESAANSCTHQGLRASLQKIHDAVSGGSTLASAVAHHGGCFPASFPAILAAAEASGDVPSAIGRVVEQLRAQLQMRGTLIGAMIYPVILITVSLLVMSALIMGVLPQFSQVFDSLGKPVPVSTAYLLALGEFCRGHLWIILGGGFVTAATVWKLRSHRALRGPLFHMLLNSPVIRSAYRPLITGRTFRTLAAMIQGGVPLLDAVRLTRRATFDPTWETLLDKMEQRLIDGQSPSGVLAEANFLPPEAAQMMSVGERTGRVGEVLEDIGKFYEEEASRLIKRLIVALEPVIILVMGVMVAGIVLSVMLPMLDVTTIQ